MNIMKIINYLKMIFKSADEFRL